MAITGGRSQAELLAEEAELALAHFDIEDALALGRILMELGMARGLGITVTVGHGGREVFRAALPGSIADNLAWLAGKERVVRRFGKSTLAVRVGFEEQGTDFYAATGLSAQRYAAHGGGWPVQVRGTGIVGFAGVSGLPQVEDHALIVEALRLLQAQRP